MTFFRLPAFTLPAPLSRIVSHLPQHPPTFALTAALNLARERVLPMDDLAPLTDRHLRLQVLDAGLTLDFTLTAGRFRPRPPSGRPDLTLSATLRDYLALALREEDADTLFFSRKLLMEGDTELGLLVKNTLDAIDWDTLQQHALPFPRLRPR